jgi:hypothetical protein
MADKEALYQILDYILNQATTDELQVISEALKRRASDRKMLGGLDPRSMAESMARNVKEQVAKMGDIGEIARKMVADMIRQKEPGISQKDLEVLLNHWLPGTRRAESGPTPGPEARQPPGMQGGTPPDLLISRVSQFIGASRGTLSAGERSELPAGWREQYWESFPHSVRELVNAHLEGHLDEVEFWQHILAAVGL